MTWNSGFKSICKSFAKQKMMFGRMYFPCCSFTSIYSPMPLVKFILHVIRSVYTETQRRCKPLYTDSELQETDVITCESWLLVHRQWTENKTCTDCHDRAAVVRQCKDTVGACLPGKQLSCDLKDRFELHFGTLAAELLPSHSRYGQMFADRFQI